MLLDNSCAIKDYLTRWPGNVNKQYVRVIHKRISKHTTSVFLSADLLPTSCTTPEKHMNEWAGWRWNRWDMAGIFSEWKWNVTVMSLIHRPLNEEHPGGRASGSSACATGQHAAGRGRGGPGEGRRGCCCCVCCHQLRRDVTWQLAWALRLQKQVEPDSQYLPHWAGEVWAGTVSQQETSADIARTSLPLLELLARSVIHWHVRSRVELLNFSLLRNTILSLSCRSNHNTSHLWEKASSDDVHNMHSNLYPLVCWHSFCSKTKTFFRWF